VPPSRCGWHLSTSGGDSLTNQKPWDWKRKDKGKHANETSSNVRISLIFHQLIGKPLSQLIGKTVPSIFQNYMMNYMNYMNHMNYMNYMK